MTVISVRWTLPPTYNHLQIHFVCIYVCVLYVKPPHITLNGGELQFNFAWDFAQLQQIREYAKKMTTATQPALPLNKAATDSVTDTDSTTRRSLLEAANVKNIKPTRKRELHVQATTTATLAAAVGKEYQSD